jgi:surfeit locus 1 family protein
LDYVVNAGWRLGLLTFSTVLAIVTTLMLGRWQLSRADQKEAIVSFMERQGGLPPLVGPAVFSLPDPSALLQRRVLLQGEWLGEKTIFLDNRPMAGRPGLYVVTPMRLEHSQAIVLVQRGWVPRNFMDRMQVPDIRTPGGVIAIEGRIVPPPGKLYEFAAAETGRIRQNLDLASFSAEVGLALPGWTVQQLGTESDGLLRQWPVVSTGVEKHYGYAFQWFALSALIAILYVWFQIVRRFIIPRRA